MTMYYTDSDGNLHEADDDGGNDTIYSGPGGNVYNPTPMNKPGQSMTDYNNAVRGIQTETVGGGAGGKTNTAAVGQIDPDPMGSTPSSLPNRGNTPPNVPGFNSPWQNSFSMEPYAQNLMDGIKVDQSGLAKYQEEANRSGPSAWNASAKTGARQAATTARNQAANDSAGQTAQAESALAMRGGLDSGARERVATAGANSFNMASQGISNQEMQGETGIDTQDEKNRIGMLTNEGAVQNQYLQPEFQKATVLEGAKAADVQGQETAIRDKNTYNQNLYDQQGQLYAAGQMAQATEKSGGNWIMTQLSRHAMLPADMRECLTAIRFLAAELEPRLTVFYFKNGKELANRMEARGHDWGALLRKVHVMCDLVRGGEVEAALRMYVLTITRCMDTYWPECDHRAVLAERRKRISRIARIGKLPKPTLMRGKLAAQCGANIPADRFES